jgi:aspartyl-tRNA(Asn)/glutamyl-tRNA(Gln) amidotransferase subunit C
VKPPVLSEEQVAHIAHLARLELTPEELTAAGTQLSAVLGYFDGLSAVDTSAVPATLGVQPRNNVFREDRVTASLTPVQALSNAPRAENDGFRIPRILDEE